MRNAETRKTSGVLSQPKKKGNMSAAKGGRKLARSSKDKGYYERQKLVTLKNKSRRARKRAEKKAYWSSAEGQARKGN